MNDIPSDIYCIIWSHLELINILHLCQCNTYLLSTLKNDLQNKIKMKRRWVEKHIVPMLHKIMNGIHILVFAPFIKYKPCFSGLTGYLDNIKMEDLSYPIMIGQDDSNRSFIVFKLKTGNTVNNYRIHVNTLFQRYSDCKHTWTSATNTRFLLTNETGLCTSVNKIYHILLEKNIKNLLNKENYVLNYTIRNELIKIHDIELYYHDEPPKPPPNTPFAAIGSGAAI